MKHVLLIKSILLFSIVLCISCENNVQEIINKTKDATVTIFTYDEYGSPAGTGSGFFIDNNGTGITNYHVLDKVVKATLKLCDGTEYEIDSVIASDKKKDIIKFTIKNPGKKKFKHLSFSKKESKQGDKIYNISSPLGYEQTFSEGTISAIRSNSRNGVNEIQITAPLSPGSSGSAIINKYGDVIAVVSYSANEGQNMNFSICMNEDILSQITENEFDKRNKKFNKKDNYVIINERSSNFPNIRLNAIEFKSDVTTAYFSYTNLDMSSGSEVYIYTELNKENDGLYILDRRNNKKYYIVSSSISEDKKNGTCVPLASTLKFKVDFAPIKEHFELETIDIYEGNKRKGWKFENIDIESARQVLNYDMDSYRKNYAYAWMHEGELDYAMFLFASILDEEPEDEDALNAMGIISFVQSNFREALEYFSESIEYHTSSSVGYKNRAEIYKQQQDFKNALSDLNKAIGIDSDNPDIYINRASLYYLLEDWTNAYNDYSKAIENEIYNEEATLYYLRAICSVHLKKYKSANNDLKLAYKYSSNPELDKEISKLYNSIP